MANRWVSGDRAIIESSYKGYAFGSNGQKVRLVEFDGSEWRCRMDQDDALIYFKESELRRLRDGEEQSVVIDYTNHRGERSRRLVRPIPETLRYIATEHHPEPQWVMDAWDYGKEAVRTFTMNDVHKWMV